MEQVILFHLYWERRRWYEIEFESITGSTDFGLYQIYGDHPIYGSDVLLYIGRATEQTLGERLSQHTDFYENSIPSYTRLHLGRLNAIDDANKNDWSESIKIIESLLINAHKPALNQKETNKVLAESFPKSVLVLNWEEYGSLYPEVSTLRHTYRFYDEKRYPIRLMSSDNRV